MGRTSAARAHRSRDRSRDRARRRAAPDDVALEASTGIAVPEAEPPVDAGEEPADADPEADTDAGDGFQVGGGLPGHGVLNRK
jgi:hypothetical protein